MGSKTSLSPQFPVVETNLERMAASLETDLRAVQETAESFMWAILSVPRSFLEDPLIQ